MKRIMVLAFVTMVLCISGCRNPFATRKEQSLSLTHEDAMNMVSRIAESIISDQGIFEDGRRVYIFVDALDTSSPMCDENIVSAGRTFDKRLREVLAGCGAFVVHDAGKCAPADLTRLPQCRFKGKLTKLVKEEGDIYFTLKAFIVNLSTSEIVWSDTISLRKWVPR